MIVLGIDSSTRTASVGLVAGDRLLAERSLAGARNLAATALPLVDEVVVAGGHDVGAVDLIAVAAGPGSFTGLRIGLSVAKGIALATGCALVGVSTLEALAAVAASAGRRGLICPLLDARRGEVYGALFRTGDGARLERVLADVAATPQELAASLADFAAAESCALIGDGVEPHRLAWQSLLPADTEFLPFAEFHPRGGVVAQLGRRQYEKHGADSVDALVPRYCRAAEAEQKRLARLADAAAGESPSGG